jgi:hypothetical protein
MAKKKEVSPVVAAIVIIVVIALIVVAYVVIGGKKSKGTADVPKMNPDQQKQQMGMIQQNMQKSGMSPGQDYGPWSWRRGGWHARWRPDANGRRNRSVRPLLVSNASIRCSFPTGGSFRS